ncbi:hypothetical protein GCM10027074_33230 [Streptomyces deserti]
MDPVDVVLLVHAAQPDAPPAELATLCTEYGVPVSEAQVRVALRLAPKQPTQPVPAAPQRPQITAVPEQADLPAPAVGRTEYASGDLHLDLVSSPQVHRQVACACREKGDVVAGAGRLHGFSHLPGPGPASSKTRGPLVHIAGRSKPARVTKQRTAPWPCSTPDRAGHRPNPLRRPWERSARICALYTN